MEGNANTSKRIARMARRMAKLIQPYRTAGDLVSARKLEAAAMETAEQMRRGAL